MTRTQAEKLRYLADLAMTEAGLYDCPAWIASTKTGALVVKFSCPAFRTVVAETYDDGLGIATAAWLKRESTKAHAASCALYDVVNSATTLYHAL